MGIKDLYKVIKDLAPQELKSYHLANCRGQRWAIDISVFLYKYIRSAGEVRWMNIFILLLCTLKRHGIKAICIFDGPHPPIEKKKEQERRRGENQKAISRLKECIRMRDLLQDKYLLEDNLKTSLKDECRSLIRARKGYKDGTNYDSIGDIVDALNDTIERLEKQTLPITDNHRKQATQIVELLGLTAIQADGEAETLCSYLAIKGLADAVLTEDTDVLAYGTPMMYAFKTDFKLSDEKVLGIDLKSLQKKMNMNQDEFRDLCILLSCDYNHRIKGYPPDGKKRKKPVNIGYKGAISMIEEYRNLEEVCKYVEDPEPLKYKRCRELFTIPKNITGAIVPYNKVPAYKELSDLISYNSLTITVEYIKDCWKPSTLKFIDESFSLSSEGEDDNTSSKDIDELNDECFVIIGAMCKDESENTEYFTVPFKFLNVEQYDEYINSRFTAIIAVFENYVFETQKKEWKIIDTIKIEEEFADPSKIIDPCVVE